MPAAMSPVMVAIKRTIVLRRVVGMGVSDGVLRDESLDSRVLSSSGQWLYTALCVRSMGLHGQAEVAGVVVVVTDIAD
jgi:hypothetical protein